MAIINIRGTSGSGKSTIVRKLMECYGSKGKVMEDGRKQPIGYICYREGGKRPLAVIGHYETACGGCDTIPKMERIYELVRKAHDNGMDVVFEGLLISADVNRTAALHTDGLPLLVIALTTPLAECIDSINKRRWTRNPDLPPVKTKNTESKYKGVAKSMERLKAQGVRAEWEDRDGALQMMKVELRL